MYFENFKRHKITSFTLFLQEVINGEVVQYFLVVLTITYSACHLIYNFVMPLQNSEKL